MNITTLDVESTISNKGNPHDQTNKLCALGLYTEPEQSEEALKIEYDEEPYGETLTRIKTILAETSLLVLFNGKFDLNWLFRYGIDYRGKIWDCQLFEFIDSNQTWVLPSLAESCSKRGIDGKKFTDIQTEFWNQGIDTTQIPWDIIEKRVLIDVQLTWKLYLAQTERFNSWSRPLQNLFRLQCDDLLVLHNIERNGFYYDEEKAQVEEENAQTLLLSITDQIYDLVGTTHINLNSDEQLSAVLYGGTIRHKYQVENGVFKTGQKAGQVRLSWREDHLIFSRLVQPLDGTKHKEKDDVWSVDQWVLGRLLWKRLSKKTKLLIELVIKYAETAKKINSYLVGISKLREKMNWPKNLLYGTINQCIARTGRTSSSKPNLQNFDSNLKILFPSRYI